MGSSESVTLKPSITQIGEHLSPMDPRELKPRFSNSSVKTGSKKVVSRISFIRFLIFFIHLKKMSQQQTTFAGF